MFITLSSGPTSEPVSLAEAKSHLRVDHSDSDVEITAMIQAARELVEKNLNLDLGERTWVYTLESFHDPIELPKSPTDGIDSIEYVDTDGNTQTLSTDVYLLEGDEIYLKYDQSWPSVRDQRAAITITFRSGGAEVPQAVKNAILLTVGDLYENREGKVIGTIQSVNPTVQALLDPHRRVAIG